MVTFSGMRGAVGLALGLMLESDSRRKSQVAIGVPKVGKGRGNSLWILSPVERFKMTTNSSLVFTACHQRRWNSRFPAFISDAIESGLGSPAPDGKIHGSIFRIDYHIGQRKRGAGDEFLYMGRVSGSIGT